MKKFFKNISKKSPGKGPPGSPKLNAHASASPTAAVIGYDVKEKDLGKLHKAAWTGDLAKVKQLAKKDPSPLDKENRTPLHLACVRGHPDVVQELLEWKAKINVGDNQSKTPLMKAVECGQEDCCVILVDNRADTDATDKNGNSCLHYAVLGGHLSIASMLCKAGANINAKNKDGSSPLHLATKQKSEDMCRVLLKERADVNIEDKNLRTPLMYACQDGSIGLVKLLLEYDADPMHKDTKGWTADDCAVIQGHHACSQLITDYTKMKGGSAASTPRTSSLAASSLLAASADAANNMGLPATDGADDSGDETVSRASGMGGPGSDSWGDDTDISLAADDRKAKAGRISLAKFVPGSGDEDSSAGAAPGRRVSTGSQNRDPSPHGNLQNRASLISQTSGDDNSWSVQESPPVQKKSSRVSFKRDEELSEIHDISLPDESEDDQQQKLARQHQERQQSGYIPSGAAAKKTPLSQERQRALMEELGISDVEDIVSDPDISEISAGNAAPQQGQGGGDSDWDSDPRHGGRQAQGTFKTFQKGGSMEEEDQDVPRGRGTQDDVQELFNEPSDWDSTVMEDPKADSPPPPPLPSSSPPPKEDEEDDKDGLVEWDSELEEAISSRQRRVSKEGGSPLPPSPARHQEDHVDAKVSHQESDWDSSVAMTPRQPQQQQQQQQQQQRAHLSHQESDWDSTVEVPTPRQAGSIHEMDPGHESDEVDEDMEAEIQSLGDSKSPRGGRDAPQDLLSAASEEGSHYVNISQLMSEQGFLPPPPQQPGQRQEEEEEDDDESEWDSEVSHPPSEMAPPPPPMAPQWQHPTSLANRSQSAGDQSEEEEKTETISEWEIDRRKQKGEKQQEVDIVAMKQTPQEAVKEKLTKRPSLEERVEAAGGDWRGRQMQGGGEPTVLSEHQATLSALQRERAELERQLSDLSDEADEVHQFSPESTFSPRTNQALLMGTSSSAGSENYLDTTLVHGVTAREELNRVTKEAEAQKQEEMKKKQAQQQQQQQQQQQGLSTGPAPGKMTSLSSVPISSSSGFPTPVVPGLSSAPAVGVYTSSAVYSTSTSTASQELRTRLQIPSLHSAPPPPPATVRVPDPLYDEDDSFGSDGMEESPKSYTNSFYREVMGQKQRLNLPLEDDCLSYTDTEMDDSFQQPLPLSADKEVLLSLNSTDSASILKVQEHLREIRRQLDVERNQRQLLETKLRNANKDRTDLSKKMEKLNQQRAELEQQKIDMEAKIRSLEYQVSEEKETRTNAELLFNKMREQLSRKEESFTNEVEAKQRAELAMRNLQLELRAAKNNIKEMEEELEDAKRMLQHERNARQLAEEVSQETQKLQQSLHKVGRRDTKEPASQVDHSAEVQALQIEMDRQRARYQEENEMLATQLDDLHTKLAEAKQQARLNEEALEHATLQYNVQHSSLRTENNVLSAAFEREKAQREKYETENESLKNRVQTAALEMQKATQARNELERELHREKEHFATELQYKEDKITSAKETIQAVTQKLEATEARLKSVENELHVSNTSLMERTAQLQQQKVEMERMRQGQESMDQNYRLEKEHSAKLMNKIEALQDKVNSTQHENLTLRQQIDVLKSSSSETKAESNDQLNTMVINLRAESERTKLTLEQKNASLADQLSHYKEELRNAQNRCNNAEQDLRRLNTEYNDVIRKLSHAEAASEITQKAKEQLEQERAGLRMEVDRLQEKFHSAHEKSIEAQARVAELLDRLERAENSNVFASQQAANVEVISKSKGELEDLLHKMQMDNSRMDSELRQERHRTETLQRDLQDSHKPFDGRTSEAPGELMQLEKDKQESTSSLDQEKRRLKKALEAKKAADAMLQAEKAKNAQLQSEISKLKAYLRAAKKRKIVDLSEEEEREMDGLLEDMAQAHEGMSSTEVELVQRELEAKYRMELNRKLDEVNAYLEEQSRRRSALDHSTQEKETRLMAERRRMEEENTNLRIKFEQAMAQRESADIEKERYKELYENEMKWRIKLWEQLQDATEKSSSLKSKLAAERQRNKFQNSLNCCSLVSNKDPPLDLGHLDNPISSLVLSGLNRSIAKHLEAAPHEPSPNVVRTREEAMMPSSFSQSNAEYFEVLKKKYCV